MNCFRASNSEQNGANAGMLGSRDNGKIFPPGRVGGTDREEDAGEGQSGQERDRAGACVPRAVA